MEYLKNLGVNAIYINPIFVAGEYHKYDLLDYFHIDPCFGTDDDFHWLIDVFHANGLKVIIDGVFNHCGWYFFAFDDVVKKESSPLTETGSTDLPIRWCDRRIRRNIRDMNVLDMNG